MRKIKLKIRDLFNVPELFGGLGVRTRTRNFQVNGEMILRRTARNYNLWIFCG